MAAALAFSLAACNHEHQFQTVVTKEATCLEKGESYDSCVLCGEQTEPKEIPALGHDVIKDAAGNAIWQFDSATHWQACSRCEEKLEENTHKLDADFECETCDYAKFEYEDYNGGYLLSKYNGTEKEVHIPASYNGKSVLGIGEDVFNKNNALTAIYLPASIRFVGRDAFLAASNLVETHVDGIADWLEIEFENYAANPMSASSDAALYFGNDKSNKLGSALEIPAGTQSINDYAFFGFGTLTTVSIPQSVTSVGYRAFEGAFKDGEDIFADVTSLEKWAAIDFSKGKTDTDKCSANPLSLGAILRVNGAPTEETLDLSGISKIGAHAFFGYANVKNIISDAQQIGEYAFANCANLKSASISATSLSMGLFKGCALLDSVTLEGTTSIGISAFENCAALAEITLPETLESIAMRAFAGCSELGTIGGAQGLNRVGESAFYDTKLFELAQDETLGQVYVGNVFVGIKGKISASDKAQGAVEIRGGTVSIADRALFNVANLIEIKLPESLKYIGKDAFRYTEITASKLTSVDLGGTVEIAEYAFAGNDKLERIQLVPSLRKIGANAFAGCSGLDEVYAENIDVLLNIEFANAQANPLSLSNALYLGTYDPQTKLTAVTLLVIPKGTQTIRANTFAGLSKATGVILPETLTAIEADAFVGCSALRSVYYSGTSAEQFEGVNVAEGALPGTVYYFSQSKPEQSAKDYWHFDDDDLPTRW